MTLPVRCVVASAALMLMSIVVGFGQTPPVPARVFAAGSGQFVAFETLLSDLTRADLVFLGEQPGDPNTHRIELAVIDGLAQRRGDVILSLEMFDRDAQEPLEHFLMGHIEEGELFKQVSAWPNYRPDYKPLVDVALAKGWPVVAANVPRKLSEDVARAGLDVLQRANRAWFARDVRCSIDDPEFKRFAPSTAQPRAPNLARAYLAHCLQGETMSESMAQAYAAGSVGGKRPLVVSINGALHSDFRGGVVARSRRRLPDARVIVVAIQPVDNVDRVLPDKDAHQRADYVIYTVGKRAN